MLRPTAATRTRLRCRSIRAIERFSYGRYLVRCDRHMTPTSCGVASITPRTSTFPHDHIDLGEDLLVVFDLVGKPSKHRALI